MSAPFISDHERIDQRSIALHTAIAAKLRSQPELVRIAEENLDRWLARGGRSTPYLEEWKRILALPLEEMLSLMVEDSERMRALRQSAPFAGVLTAKERWRIYDAYTIGAYYSRGGGDHG